MTTDPIDALVIVGATGDLAMTVLWTAGVQAPPLADKIAAATGATQGRIGRIEVTSTVTIPGHPETTVIGDRMSRDHLPGVAEVAMQGGRHAGRRVLRTAGRPRRLARGRRAHGWACLGRPRIMSPTDVTAPWRRRMTSAISPVQPV
jgi:hypothetical protein